MESPIQLRAAIQARRKWWRGGINIENSHVYSSVYASKRYRSRITNEN